MNNCTPKKINLHKRATTIKQISLTIAWQPPGNSRGSNTMFFLLQNCVNKSSVQCLIHRLTAAKCYLTHNLLYPKEMLVKFIMEYCLLYSK
jgi:hypothetical protein